VHLPQQLPPHTRITTITLRIGCMFFEFSVVQLYWSMLRDVPGNLGSQASFCMLQDPERYLSLISRNLGLHCRHHLAHFGVSAPQSSRRHNID
jgi:hypothetical protein